MEKIVNTDYYFEILFHLTEKKYCLGEKKLGFPKVETFLMKQIFTRSTFILNFCYSGIMVTSKLTEFIEHYLQYSDFFKHN